MAVGFHNKKKKKYPAYADEYSWAEDDFTNNNLVSNVNYYLSHGNDNNFHKWLGKRVFKPREADLIIFIDGVDVDPELCNQEKLGSSTIVSSYSKERNREEIKLYYDTLDIPKLGIGNGAILLGVLNGASIIQSVTGHLTSHDIYTNDGEIFPTNGYHKSILNLSKCKNANLLAWTFKSDKFEGCLPIEIPNGNKRYPEPEIVHFEDTKSLCIQFRPDWMDCPRSTGNYVDELIKDLIDETL